MLTGVWPALLNTAEGLEDDGFQGHAEASYLL